MLALNGRHVSCYRLVSCKYLQLLVDQELDGILNSGGQATAVSLLLFILRVTASGQPAALAATNKTAQALGTLLLCTPLSWLAVQYRNHSATLATQDARCSKLLGVQNNVASRYSTCVGASGRNQQ